MGLRPSFGQIFFLPLPSYQQLTIHFALLDFASFDGASAPRRLDSSARSLGGRPAMIHSIPSPKSVYNVRLRLSSPKPTSNPVYLLTAWLPHHVEPPASSFISDAQSFSTLS